MKNKNIQGIPLMTLDHPEFTGGAGMTAEEMREVFARPTTLTAGESKEMILKGRKGKEEEE